MIFGTVNGNREALVQIVLLGTEKQLRNLTAVIDTGFTGDLMIPEQVVMELGWAYRGVQEAVLGDGSFCDFEVYAGTLIWDGQIRSVEVNACTSGILVGMGLLEGWKLEVEGRAGGSVRITDLFDR
ncbi:MAG: clan AA aspartic protease [Alkalinema sp. CACIAM 70d]|nr:MAG: clan AA aspartic protease [Alkalinema sp. CACIAM 70d]